MHNLTVICADIGSVAKGNFGWWSSHGDSGITPSTLAAHIPVLLSRETPVALGFECPLFVPLAADEIQLTSSRPGEGSRAWSAGAGCGALATGIVQIAWVLQAVHRQLLMSVPAFLDWPLFVSANSGLFLWEAFVSGTAKMSGHTADAQAGAESFMKALPNPEISNAVICSTDVFSLVGAALLRTGWCSGPSILKQPCIVIRADKNAD